MAARSGLVALAVREIHQPIEALNVRYGQKQQVCTGCGADDGNWQIYPCPTIRAVERAEATLYKDQINRPKASNATEES